MPLQIPQDHVARCGGGVVAREGVAAHGRDSVGRRRSRLFSAGARRTLYGPAIVHEISTRSAIPGGSSTRTSSRATPSHARRNSFCGLCEALFKNVCRSSPVV